MISKEDYKITYQYFGHVIFGVEEMSRSAFCWMPGGCKKIFVTNIINFSANAIEDIWYDLMHRAPLVEGPREKTFVTNNFYNKKHWFFYIISCWRENICHKYHFLQHGRNPFCRVSYLRTPLLWFEKNEGQFWTNLSCFWRTSALVKGHKGRPM